MKYGVINVYKDAGMTSFQVVYRLRKMTGEKKIGHTGTLDPDATGVLPVCIGKATKLVDYLMDSDKEYRARMLFGTKTDTQDTTGKVLEAVDNERVHLLLGRTKGDMAYRIEEALRHFTGEIMQLPPMYSAIKVAGVKLVDAARKGRAVERKPRPARIHAVSDVQINGLSDEKDALTADFTVRCSKGTYIRTLCEDIGAYLGLPACMQRLERTKTGGMDLASAHTLEELEKAAQENRLEDLIIPTDAFLTKYPPLIVKESAVRKLVFGNYLTKEEFEEETALPARKEAPFCVSLEEGTESDKPRFRIYDAAGNFYAVYYYDAKTAQYKCDKMFIEEPNNTCN